MKLIAILAMVVMVVGCDMEPDPESPTGLELRRIAALERMADSLEKIAAASNKPQGINNYFPVPSGDFGVWTTNYITTTPAGFGVGGK
jgi:hypothetical protein